MRPRRQWREDAAIRAMYWLMAAIAAGILLAFFFAPRAHAHAEDSMDLETFLVIPRLDDTQKMLYLGLLAAVDYHQSVEFVVKQPELYYETNPILGRHPGRQRLALFGLAGLALVRAAQRVLPPALSRVVVDSIVATEQTNVWENQYAVGPHARTSEVRRTSMPVMVALSYQF